MIGIELKAMQGLAWKTTCIAAPAAKSISVQYPPRHSNTEHRPTTSYLFANAYYFFKHLHDDGRIVRVAWDHDRLAGI